MPSPPVSQNLAGLAPVADMNRPQPSQLFKVVAAILLVGLPAAVLSAAEKAPRLTRVSSVGDQFFINGRPTYPGRTRQNHRVERLLFNTRMVQRVYDDLNPATVGRRTYPDFGKRDAERNTREFIAAMPQWRAPGVLPFTLNFQGGSPQSYSKEQPWVNSAFASDGTLYLGDIENKRIWQIIYTGQTGHDSSLAAAVLPPDRERYQNRIPPFAAVNDSDPAEIVNYLRRAFGSNAPSVALSQIAALRTAIP